MTVIRRHVSINELAQPRVAEIQDRPNGEPVQRIQVPDHMSKDDAILFAKDEYSTIAQLPPDTEIEFTD